MIAGKGSRVLQILGSRPQPHAVELISCAPPSCMGPWANPVLVSLWLLSLSLITLAGVHHVSFLEVISPQAAPGLPKQLSVMRANDLLFLAYNGSTDRDVPHGVYTQGSSEFSRRCKNQCLAWSSWVDTTYQVLVNEVNTSSPTAEPYYLQILKQCELDNATGALRAMTRYALNGEDVLQHQADQNRWFSMHPAARRVVERWNGEGDNIAMISHRTLQDCKSFIESTRAFLTGRTARPTARVAFVPGTQDRPRHLVCHVTGFYPRDIEVTWERRGVVVQGEQLTSGIRPNGDPTFQIQVSIELGQERVDPSEHVCVVRHSSLGDTSLRVPWESQAWSQTAVLVIAGGCLLLAALGIGVLVQYLSGREAGWKKSYHSTGTLDPAPPSADPGEGASCM